MHHFNIFWEVLAKKGAHWTVMDAMSVIANSQFSIAEVVNFGIFRNLMVSHIFYGGIK